MMWTVKSESGRLRAVMIQDSTEQLWTRRLPFAGIESSTMYCGRDPHAQMEPGHGEWLQLPKILKDEGVEVFEVKSMLENIIGDSTLNERREIIKEVWADVRNAPEPENLMVEQLFWGYPSEPYYDERKDRVVLPDHRMVSWTYPRDTSFTTQVGTVICNMRRYSRKYEPRIVKLCYEYNPVLSEKLDIIHDANEVKGVFTEPPCIEGGDTQIVDEETITIGVGQRSTVTGVIETAKRLIEADTDNELKYICAVNLANYPAVDYMHLDVTINYPDNGKALVMPYIYDTKLLNDYPPKKLLLKTLEAARKKSEADARPLEPLVHPQDFSNFGRTSIYMNRGGKPELIKVEDCLIDFLIKEGKLEKDSIIYVGGQPKKKNDVKHLLETMMEQSRGAPNIVTLRPGIVISYDRNKRTNDELRNRNITVKEWSSSYLDLLGGPHCSTCPLDRDA
jgi:arginine deiminase